nr:MAG TPA: hypothetical protein [Caudoviricetes sp.]
MIPCVPLYFAIYNCKVRMNESHLNIDSIASGNPSW